jgi:aryl-alcohol dehydrogenase-like predicted oxidoreductase
MYPVPPSAATQGKTEVYIGQWLKKQQRDQIIIATKIAGPGRPFKWLGQRYLKPNFNFFLHRP